jgi:hypothetical protein
VSRWPERSLRERFFEKVDITPGCWLWKAYSDNLGYGKIGTVGKKTALAHRVSWELHHGPIGAGLLVCHHCDTPSCVNPNHLFLGTDQDNMNDRGAKGRTNRPQGTKHHSAKLTEEKVLELRIRRIAGEGLATMATECGVHVETVRKACAGKGWRHI